MAGGDRALATGFYVQPTIFADVTDDMTIAKEEAILPPPALARAASFLSRPPPPLPDLRPRDEHSQVQDDRGGNHALKRLHVRPCCRHLHARRGQGAALRARVARRHRVGELLQRV